MSVPSPQRSRKPLATAGSMQTLQRENSPSPSSFRDRPRTNKTQSMPMVPSAPQIYSAQQQQQHSNPTSPNINPSNTTASRRSPSHHSQPQVQRLLPTPPQPNPPPMHDDHVPDRHGSMSPNNANVLSPIHPRPIPRGPPPQFLTKFNLHDMEMEGKWQMTDELMAEIERADQDMQAKTQQQYFQQQSQPGQVQSLSYLRDREGQSPARDPAVERVRTMGRGGSPKDNGGVGESGAIGGAQLPRRQNSIRDRERGERDVVRGSPKSMHPRSQTPEIYGAHGHVYRPHLSIATQAQTHTPPLQTINSNVNRTERTPEVPLTNSGRVQDKSLPVQEELDEDCGEHQRLGGSPLPSSDLNPDGNPRRTTHRLSLDSHPKAISKNKLPDDEDEDETLFEKSDRDVRGQDQDVEEEDGDLYSFTPRSAQVGLPEPLQPQKAQGRTPSHSQSQSPPAATSAPRDRPRSSDQAPLSTKYDQHQQQTQKPTSPLNAPRAQGPQQPFYLHHNPMLIPGTPDNLSLYSHSINSADFDHPTSAYIQAYLRSSYPSYAAYENSRQFDNHSRGSRPRDERPDAPIPPTPHSQTNPPSPSPLLSGPYALDDMSSMSQMMDGIYLRGELEGFDGMGIESEKEYGGYLPPFSPIVPAGSPYPYPFAHVRRAKSYANQPHPLAQSKAQSSSNNGAGAAAENANAKTNGNNANATTNTTSSVGPNADHINNPAIIQEQFARQWQIYAQNLQAQLDMENGGGDITDSTFSPPSATASLLPPISRAGGINGHVPFNPWAYWHTQRLLGRRPGGGTGSITARSSPSHEPVPLPTPPPMGGGRRKGRSMDLGSQVQGMDSLSGLGFMGARNGYADPKGLGLSGMGMATRGRGTKPAQPHPLRQGRKPPPRVESTQPRETSPEPLGSSSDSGEETAGEGQFVSMEEGSWVNGSPPLAGSTGAMSSLGLASVPLPIGPQPRPATMAIPIVDDSNVNGVDTPDGGDLLNDWVDDDEDSDEDDLLELEYHPSFVSNVEKRRRRWENRWESLHQAFQALDRQTDATMILLAAPSHSSKLHMVTSRSIRRRSDMPHSSSINTIRAGFKQIASQRRRARTMRTSLADRFLLMTGQSIGSGGSGDGSDGSSDMSSTRREEDLKRALDAALGSLGFLGNLYEEREARWTEEMRKVREERERVAFLLTQVLGDTPKQSPSLSDGTSGQGSTTPVASTVDETEAS